MSTTNVQGSRDSNKEASLASGLELRDQLLTDRHIRYTFYGLLLLYLVWMYAIPEFPTMDGPLHLYYAHVLAKLLSGSKHFHRYYCIHHYLPPYCLHIYLILVLESILPVSLVTKTIVAICFVLNCFGLRYLVRSLTGTDSVFSIFGIPLGLSWPLFMGFFAYMLGLGLALFAVGLWCRIAQRRSKINVTVFLLLIALLVLTHPVPLLLVLAFCTTELMARLICRRGNFQPKFLIRGLFILFVAAVLSSYVLLFIGPPAEHNGDTINPSVTTVDMLTAEYVVPFLGPWSYILRLLLVLLLLFVIQCSLFGILRRLRNRRLTYSDILSMLGTLLLLILPLLPFHMNGGAFFGQRLVVVVWLVFIATAGTHINQSPKSEKCLCVTALLFGLFTVGLAQSSVTKTVSDVATVPKVNRVSDLAGLLFAPFPDLPENRLDFDPFLLSGAKIFLESDAALLNPPWMRFSWQPFTGTSETYTQISEGHPSHLARTFESSPAIGKDLLQRANLIVISGKEATSGRNRKDLLRGLINKDDWACSESPGYEVCLRKPR